MFIVFVLIIIICVIFIIISIEDGRPEEIKVPITIIIIMIIAIVMYIRNPQSLTRENNDEPILEVTQETESKTNIRFTEEVYRTDKRSRIFILTDTEQRIFLKAMSREREVCQKVDDGYSEDDSKLSLVKICNSIERKVKKIWE